MSEHGTPLTTVRLRKLSGTVVLNLPEIDSELALDFSNNADALAIVLERALTRENLDAALVELGKKRPEPKKPIEHVGDCFRETGELAGTMIQIPALPRPTLAELREKFPWIRGENGIERDISPEGAVTLVLGTVLREGEPSISGLEYERRLALVSRPLFGYQQLAWLVEHQDEHPVFKALLGQIYIDGPGLVVVIDDGVRYFPSLDQIGKRWNLDLHWIGRGLYSRGRIASGKQ